MTTTTAPTSTSSATTTAITTATQQLLSSLGTGSGVDTTTLVSSLVKAEFAGRTDALATEASTLTTQISGVATLKSTIASFATALQSLATGGTLTTQPVSSDASVLTATALPGAKLAGLPASITVSQLASGEAAHTTSPVADRAAAIGSGTFTLTFGTATTSPDGTSMTGFTAGPDAPVTIDVADASLDDIAAAINTAGAGVTASIVADADGSAYLSLKGPSGAAQAFSLQATSDPGGGLSQFDVGVGASGSVLSSVAQNARVSVDGVSVERSSNTIGDLIDGVKLQLAATSTTPVSLTSASPTSALSQAVSNFVDTYNQVLTTVTGLTDPKTGALASDPAAQALLRSLQSLASTPILTGADVETNGPASLSDIGVATQRDGTLQLDSSALSQALASYPKSVEAMFAWSTNATDGLTAAVSTISTAAADPTYGLTASTATYTAAQSDVTDQQSELTDESTNETTRLTQQFADMNSKVAAYKSTQSFLTNQIAAWNKSS